MHSDQRFITLEYATAIAQAIAVRTWFYIGDGSYVCPAIYTVRKRVEPKLMKSAILLPSTQANIELCRKRFRVEFVDGCWVEIELWKSGPIVSDNPPIIGAVTLHALLWGRKVNYPPSADQPQQFSFHHGVFNEYGTGTGGKVAVLSQRLQRFLPDFAPFYAQVLQDDDHASAALDA
ncbi:MAG: hypothetical protein A3C15_01360 [Candidatus Magasanikbacteria bacterium RIFCSPHIGHO2_02_FULL_50_9b]|uniref:Uncharacterized protein n=1 Tax=Candidatus Magasanikbacteria bacterium RIFCSPHIGHO2_02_FULL_50_9b TaxID=1798682 RepID=A0A1F6M7R2_9BACT|nr:MAG: hypothetical protein A3C15_01360 [Candidatus Magasanikbacteria bacterium RIFCSPHIGHO2_02_FULL_50_9b]